jgi:hypothetical protein
MKMDLGIIDMAISKWTWLCIMVVSTVVILNYFTWIERVEWLRNIQ